VGAIAVVLGLQVDAGSDDSDELFNNLPMTLAAAAAAERRQRQQPLLDLCKGYRHRRLTLNDSKQQYNDVEDAGTGAGAGLLPLLPIVADNMLQVCCSSCPHS
jgi:hypothetical protein